MSTPFPFPAPFPGSNSDFGAVGVEPVAEPLYGFRAFKLGNDHALTGVYMTKYEWKSDVNTARCQIRADQPESVALRHEPSPSCQCGFWAYQDGAHVFPTGGGARAVLGVIVAWGRMRVGPLGFRAEHARIEALTFPRYVASSTTVVAVPNKRSIWDKLSRKPPTVTVHEIETVESWRPEWGYSTVSNSIRAPWEDHDEATREAVSERYPLARIYPDVPTMLAAHPPSDLSKYLPEQQQQTEDDDG